MNCFSSVGFCGGREREACDGRIASSTEMLHQELPEAANLCILVSVLLTIRFTSEHHLTVIFFAHLALSKNPQGLPLTFNTRSATSSETACNSRNLFPKSLAWIIRCKYFWLGFGINFGRIELFIVLHFQCWIDYNRRVFCNSIEEEQTGCALLQISMIFGGIRVSAKFFPAARTKLFSQLWHLCIFALMSPSYSQWSNSLLVLQIVQRIKISTKQLLLPSVASEEWKSPVSSCFLWRLKKTNLEGWPTCPKKNLQKRICNLCLLAAGQPEPSCSANFCFPCSRNTACAAAGRPLINGEKWIANASTSQPAHMLANSAPVGNTNPIFKPDWTPRFRPTSANPDFP